MPSPLPDLHLKKDTLWAWRATKGFFLRHKIKNLIILLAVIATAIFFTFPNDLAWFKIIRGDKDPDIRKIAQQIGHTGNLAQYNFLVIIVLWGLGFWRKSRYLQRLAMVVFVSTVLAGAFCNIFRFSLGRPRPFTKLPPTQFQGPQFEAKYHGFPSGHTSTAFGTAVPVFTAMPVTGAPVLIYAGAMGWARMYDKAHYPTDVLVGTYIGTAFGLAATLPLVRIRNRGRRIAAASRNREKIA